VGKKRSERVEQEAAKGAEGGAEERKKRWMEDEWDGGLVPENGVAGGEREKRSWGGGKPGWGATGPIIGDVRHGVILIPR